MIGAAAAITDLQIAIPNQLRSVGEISRWKTPKDHRCKKGNCCVGRLIFKEDKPVEATVAIGKLNPMKIIEYCNNLLTRPVQSWS